MKVPKLLVIALLCLSPFQSLMSKPTALVTHSHDGRIHTHPLPVHGLSHKHGNSSEGVSVNINSSVQLSEKKKTITSTTGNNQTKKTSVKPEKIILEKSNISLNMAKGDTNCRAGEPDCNICAINVKQQFNQAAAGKIRWKMQRWDFNWNNRYPPQGTRPLDVFDGDPVYALRIPNKHVQGFVRTNSRAYPYAGSHSHKSKGSVFVIGSSRHGNNLSLLKKTNSRHPSAVHTFGQYLVYGDNNKLVFLNLSALKKQANLSLKIPKSGYGGGLGLTRLSNNNGLLITTTPGGQKSGARYHRFYHLKTNKGKPLALRFINQATSSVPNYWPRAYQYSENLSVITECGTGDIYTIHTSGNEKGASMIRGNGYWRLSQVKSHKGKLHLQPIGGFSSKQNMVSCSMRAAATVFANQNNYLEFYCHGYAKDPDGSTFNVLGPSSRNADKFYYKIGIL